MESPHNMRNEISIRSAFRLLLTLSYLFVCSVAYANDSVSSEQEQIMDFAYGAEVNAQNGFPFYRVDLPKEAYYQSAWSDLRDIRVFNHDGRVLPFTLYHDSWIAERITTVPMSLFTLESKVQTDVKNRPYMSFEVDGAKYNVPQMSGDKVSSYNDSYVLKLNEEKKPERPLERLALSWEKADKNWQGKISLYQRNKDGVWSLIVSNMPIMDLSSGSERLLINEIKLSEVKNNLIDFYMIVISGDADIPTLTGVNGVFVTHDRQEQQNITLAFTAKTLPGGDIEYQLPNGQPLENLSITSDRQNTILVLGVQYRQSAESDWVSLPNQRVYALRSESGELSVSKPISLNSKVVQAIRIKAISGDIGHTLPIVKGERKSFSVIFNGQGETPYMLAWGSKKAQSKAIFLDQLMPDKMWGSPLDRTQLASTDNPLVLGGEQRLQAEVATESLWPRLMLWLVLILGVAGLGLFAVKVWKEIKQKSAL